MAFNYASTRKQLTPATQKILGRENDMIENDGGGVSFKLEDFQFLDRFLILGATSGTFYLSKEKHEYRNLENVIRCIKKDGAKTVERIVEVSSKGLAQKNDHAIYALALVFVHGDDNTKNLAKSAFSKVIRIGTHLFMFCEFIKSMRGFGKIVRGAIQDWYNDKNDYGMALQVSKYQQREGWSHLDVFRLAHPKFGDGAKNTIAKWAMNKSVELDANNDGLRLLHGVELAKTVGTDKAIVKLIADYKLQREHIPSVYLNLPGIQEALLPHMGATALVRNLGNMSKSGLITPLSKSSKFIVEKLHDKEWIKAGKLHPLSIAVAQKIYASGRGMLGSGVWKVDQNIVTALEEAFYLAFDTIEPTGKNYFYGLDVSGSMSSDCPGAHMSYCEVAAILAMAHVRTERNTFVGGFSSNFVELGITKRDTLKQAAKKCSDRNFGCTNPSAAIEYANRQKMSVDAFIFITDNDINSGYQPVSVLKKYRKDMGVQSKMIVCGLLANPYTIADPNDVNMLDIAGFSPDITSVITNFTK